MNAWWKTGSRYSRILFDYYVTLLPALQTLVLTKEKGDMTAKVL